MRLAVSLSTHPDAPFGCYLVSQAFSAKPDLEQLRYGPCLGSFRLSSLTVNLIRHPVAAQPCLGNVSSLGSFSPTCTTSRTLLCILQSPESGALRADGLRVTGSDSHSCLFPRSWCDRGATFVRTCYDSRELAASRTPFVRGFCALPGLDFALSFSARGRNVPSLFCSAASFSSSLSGLSSRLVSESPFP